MTSISHVDSADRRLFLLMTFLKYYLQNVHIITQHETVKILNKQHTKSILSAACAPWRQKEKRQGSRLMHFPDLILICLCVQVFRSSITA